MDQFKNDINQKVFPRQIEGIWFNAFENNVDLVADCHIYVRKRYSGIWLNPTQYALVEDYYTVGRELDFHIKKETLPYKPDVIEIIKPFIRPSDGKEFYYITSVHDRYIEDEDYSGVSEILQPKDADYEVMYLPETKYEIGIELGNPTSLIKIID